MNQLNSKDELQKIADFEGKANRDATDRNINNISIPIKIATEDEYLQKLKEIYCQLVQEVSKPAFNGLAEKTSDICDYIVSLIDNSRKENEIVQLLSILTKENRMFCSNLNENYALRMSAYLEEDNSIRPTDLSVMQQHGLSLFRVVPGRVSNERRMFVCPYDKYNKEQKTRFGMSDVPCLYLGTTSYVCYHELGCPDEYSLSGYKPNDLGDKLKILNLAISPSLINGHANFPTDYELQEQMIEILPFVIATSFLVETKGKDRIEYKLSRMIMETLSSVGIDGVAYLSSRGKNDFQYPQGVNLAFPAKGHSDTDYRYGKIMDSFYVTAPVCNSDIPLEHITISDKQAYLNAVVPKRTVIDMIENEKYYSETLFSKIDDYIETLY